MFDPPIFRDGARQISAGALTRLSEEVARQAGTANTLSGIEGIHDLPPGPDATLARVVGKGDVSGGLPVPFLWLAVTPTNTDGTTPLYSDNPAFGFGATGINPAYEASGDRDVPTDGSVVVALTPAGDGSHFTFQAPAEDLVPLKITADLGSGKYSAIEEAGATGGTYADLPGGVSTSLLYEENDTAGIAVNTVVYARRGFGSGYPHVLVWVSQFGDDTAVSNIQSVRIRGAAAGTFTLTYDDDTTGAAPNPHTTAAIAWNVSGAALKAALEALPNVTTVNITGAGTDASPYLVELVDDFASHQLLVPDYSALTGHQEWVFTAPFELTVQEVDGSPSYSHVTTLQVPNDAGIISNPSAGVVNIVVASPTTGGFLTAKSQSLGGHKTLFKESGAGASGLSVFQDESGASGNYGMDFGFNTLFDAQDGAHYGNWYFEAASASGKGGRIVADPDNHRVFLAMSDSPLGAMHNAVWSVRDAAGVIHDGAYGTTTGGDTVSGGLITAVGSTGATITIGTTPVSGGTVGNLLTIGAGPVVSNASLSSLLDALGGVTGGPY